MSPVMLSAVSGLVGGFTRALVGIGKAQAANAQSFQFNWQYFVFSMCVSGFVGTVAGLIAGNDWHTALLAGYAGSDFLESMFKIKFTAATNVVQTPPPAQS